MQRSSLVSSFLFSSMLVVAPADAAEESGFFLRSSLGFGHSWTHAEATEVQPDVSMKAWAPALMLSPGYQFFPGLAAHADVYGAMHFANQLKPDVDVDEYEPEGIGLLGFVLGVGLTYQPSPGSLYVSGGLGFSEVWGSRWQFEGDEGASPLQTSTAGSYPGYAFYCSVGELFDVNERWAVGPSLNYNFKSVGRPGEEDLTFSRVHTLWLGLSTVFHPKK